MKRKLVLLTILLPLLHSAFGQQHIARDLTRELDNLLEQRDPTSPGGVIVAAIGGKIFYQKAKGLASIELQTQMTDVAVFEAASVSKQFAATAVLKLVEAGKLALEDDIRGYIPELPDYGHVITIRHLLTMTSGLRDWRNTTYLIGRPTYEHVYTQEDALAIICKQQGLNFLPGEQYSYCNSNYDLLNVLVSRIADKPFIEYATQEVLDPVDFKQSRWRDNPYEVIDNKVQAYTKVNGKYILSPVLEKTHGAAGMLVDAVDLVRWADFWAGNGFGEAIGALRTQQGVLNNGDTIDYASGGVWVKNLNGFKEIAHSGLLGGFRSWVANYPELGLSVAFLTNDKSFEQKQVRSRIEKTLNGMRKSQPEIEKRPIPADLAQKLAGHYRNIAGFQVAELKQRGQILTLNADTLYSLSADTLVLGETRFVLRDGAILEAVGSDESIVYKKCNLPATDEESLVDLLGTYTCPDIDLTIRFEVADGKLKAYRKPYDGVVLHPAFEDGGEVGFYGFLTGLKTVFRFSRDAHGQRLLHVSIPRAENFRFERHVAN